MLPVLVNWTAYFVHLIHLAQGPVNKSILHRQFAWYRPGDSLTHICVTRLFDVYFFFLTRSQIPQNVKKKSITSRNRKKKRMLIKNKLATKMKVYFTRVIFTDHFCILAVTESITIRTATQKLQTLNSILKIDK